MLVCLKSDSTAIYLILIIAPQFDLFLHMIGIWETFRSLKIFLNLASHTWLAFCCWSQLGPHHHHRHVYVHYSVVFAYSLLWILLKMSKSHVLHKL